MYNDPPGFFLSFSCSELESLISHDRLQTYNNEVSVLKVVIDWAGCRSSRPAGLCVGDEVRVRTDCPVTAWRGSDCVVQSFTAWNTRVVVQRLRGDGEGDGALRQTIELDRTHVCDAGETGMCRLLSKVRYAYIPVEHLKTRLWNAGVSYASQYECYRDLVRKVVRVRTGMVKVTGEAAKPREGYDDYEIDDHVESWERVLMHWEEPQWSMEIVHDKSDVPRLNVAEAQAAADTRTDKTDNASGKKTEKASATAATAAEDDGERVVSGLVQSVFDQMPLARVDELAKRLAAELSRRREAEGNGCSESSSRSGDGDSTGIATATGATAAVADKLPGASLSSKTSLHHKVENDGDDECHAHAASAEGPRRSKRSRVRK